MVPALHSLVTESGLELMKPEDKEVLRLKIHEQIEKIQSDVAALEEEAKPIAPDNAYGRLSRMDAMNSRSVSENSLRMARGKLDRLRRALTKIDEKNFGVCNSCGKAIQPKRLMFLPDSTRCVYCADR